MYFSYLLFRLFMLLAFREWRTCLGPFADCRLLCLVFSGVTGLRLLGGSYPLHRRERLNALPGVRRPYDSLHDFNSIPQVNVFPNYEFLDKSCHQQAGGSGEEKLYA